MLLFAHAERFISGEVSSSLQKMEVGLKRIYLPFTKVGCVCNLLLHSREHSLLSTTTSCYMACGGRHNANGVVHGVVEAN